MILIYNYILTPEKFTFTMSYILRMLEALMFLAIVKHYNSAKKIWYIKDDVTTPS